MQLTSYTDYSLRALLYIGGAGDRQVTITEISTFYGISRNHMVKVVQNLSALGYIKATRGAAGGLRLARPPAEIGIAAVVRDAEPHMNIQECFDRETNTCPLIDNCRLMGALYQARKAFMDTLARYTLADMLPVAKGGTPWLPPDQLLGTNVPVP